MSTRHQSAVVTLPNDTSILITRAFEAPQAHVWSALTTPRHLLRWWGPTWCPLVGCEIDLRVGGSWRYVSRMEDGTELGWHGTYREIVQPERVVTTEVFEGFPDAESVNTMTLTHADGITTLQTLVQHSSQEHRDGHIASGMEGGMQQTFDRLDTLLDTMVAGGESDADRFHRFATRFTDVVRAVPATAWNGPSPCAGWTARDIVRHMADWMSGMMAGIGLPLQALPSVDDDPLAASTSLVDQLQAVLDDPVTASREVVFGPAGTHTVARGISMIMLGDIVIHTWDLARAAGLDDTLDPDMVHGMLEGMRPMDEVLRSSGHYGPKVAVADDADEQTQLIAFTGRDPSWHR